MSGMFKKTKSGITRNTTGYYRSRKKKNDLPTETERYDDVFTENFLEPDDISEVLRDLDTFSSRNELY